MQAWESELSGVGGIPFIENRNKIQIFKFSYLEITELLIHVFLIEDSDPIFKILKNLLDGSARFFGTRLFDSVDSQDPNISKHDI